MNDSTLCRTLLVVEGRDDIRMLLCALARREGFDVAAAVDGAEAIQLLSTTRFDAVVLDSVLPRVSAEDVLAYYRGRYPGARNVILTTTRPASVASIDRRGIFDVVAKPFDIDSLAHLIAACASGREAA